MIVHRGIEYRGDNPVVGWRPWINHRICHRMLGGRTKLKKKRYLTPFFQTPRAYFPVMSGGRCLILLAINNRPITPAVIHAGHHGHNFGMNVFCPITTC